VQNFYNLPVKQIAKIFKVYRDRFNLHKVSGQVIIFCNNGERAGASIKHSHSQIVVLPNQINIDTLVREPYNNVISENKYFTTYCPEFSQWPYEVWIAPKTVGKMFGDISDEEIRDISKILLKITKKLKGIHKLERVAQKEFNFNFYIHSKENWYLRIIPRFVHRAGFELGTGLSVNIIDPSQAAQDLR
jgi:UDPglucose--hexose-1-phosphate uridylyltransferase